jgi:enamine deaminase RidA (YjgF/YER057c/UK114 family)
MLVRLATAVTLATCLSIAPAAAQQFEKKNFNYSKFATGVFSEAVTVTGAAKTIYLAGIGAEDPDSGSVQHKDNVLEQCRMAWANVTKALDANGAMLNDIVKVTTYATDVSYLKELRQCWVDTFKGLPLPAHTFLNVARLARPDMLVEVDVVAAVAAK